MKKRKRLPYRVIATTAMATILLSTTGYAEGIENNQIQAPGIDEIVKQGQKIFQEENKYTSDGVVDKFGYNNLNKMGLIEPYKPNEKVRVIVEVEMPETKVKNHDKKAKLKHKQDEVIAKITKKKSVFKVKHRFYEGFNGFSIETEFRHVKDIQATSGVTSVHIAKTFQPSMGASKELVQAQKVWEEYGYGGEGLLVAIVDSGLDYTHQDMTLTETGKEQQKWSEDSIQAKLEETDINDVWYSDKVPTGYDWADEDTEVVPQGEYANSHGMHVAGTVGANGDESNDGVQGVAPGVQLLAEKVFSDNGGGAYEDDIIAGIEHAIIMGADVINMSLGSDAGFVGEENDPIQKAIRQATEQGTLVVVAGGNAAYSTKNNVLKSSEKPYAENPDIGTVGEPAVSPYALAVASYENSKMHMRTLVAEDGFQLPYQDQTHIGFKLSKALTPNQSYDMVYVGEGKRADYTDKEVEGKIVVVKPKQDLIFYSSVQREAKNKGAKAIILVPATTMKDLPFLNFSYALTQGVTTSKEAGDALIAKLQNGEKVKMKMSKGTWIENPAKETISNFSSFGTPHNLDFKPEISAPGGNIYSTVVGNDYELMSGTSMAAPHVAGGSALLLQALYEKGLSQSKETVLKSKIALMNTAQVVQDPRTNNQIPYSPRLQGSGLMQIQNAIKTPVLVTAKNAPIEKAGAVALKEITKNAHFKLNVEALEKTAVKDLEYTILVDLLTDETETKEYDLDNDGKVDSKEYLTLTSQRVEGAKVYVNDELVSHTEGKNFKIKPGQAKNLDIRIVLPDSQKKGKFVEGFVRLIPTGKNSNSAVPLTVPFMGYYGDWDHANNLDPVAWDKNAFLGYTVLWDDEGAQFPMGYDPYSGTFNMDRMVFSPNTTLPGVFPTFTTLRNLEKTEMYIENEKGEMIQFLGDFSEYTGTPWKFRKNVMIYQDYMNAGYLWNIKDQNGQTVKDGTYNYVIKTTLDYKGAQPQEVKLPVHVDSVAPIITDIQVQPKNVQYEISFKAIDNEGGSGFKAAIIWYNGKYRPLQEGASSVLVNEEPKSVVVLGADYALNHGYKVWGDPSYINEEMLVSYFSVYPNKDVNAANPAGINAFANNRVNWTINIKDVNGMVVDSFLIEDEHEIHLKWTPKADLPDGTYTVSAEVSNKQGFKVSTSPHSVMVQHEE